MKTKKLEKPFNPRDYRFYSELPPEKREDYKPVGEEAGPFVSKTTIENSEQAQEEAERIVLAKTLKLRYEKGEFEPADVRRNTYGEPRGPVYRYPEIKGAKLDLFVKLPDLREKIIWLRNDFRLALNIKRFTLEIIDLIRETMPKIIQVEEYKDGSLRIAPDDLIAWANKVRELEYKKQKPEFKEELERRTKGFEEELIRRKEKQMENWLTRKNLIKLAQKHGFFIGNFNKKVAEISLRHQGWIGQIINKQGQLVTVYSPELFEVVKKELSDEKN